MTDMDEIRELLSEYADAVFDRGAASGASNEVYPPNAGETSSRSALLQRVEALREERDGWQRAAQTAGQYREMERARAEAAESALAALRAAPPDALRALSGAWRLRVAGYSTDLGTPHGTEAMVYRRCAAELDAALAPSPPETPAPEGSDPDLVPCPACQWTPAARSSQRIHGRHGGYIDPCPTCDPDGKGTKWRASRSSASPASAPTPLLQPFTDTDGAETWAPASAPSRGSGEPPPLPAEVGAAILALVDAHRAAADLDSSASLSEQRAAIVACDEAYCSLVERIRTALRVPAPSPTSTDPEEILP